MAARNMRIKVNVVDLIARIEQVRDSAEAEYAKALAKYERDNQKFQDKVRGALTKLCADWDNGEPFQLGSSYFDRAYRTAVALPFKVDFPQEPNKPNPTQANQDIALLRMSADDTLSISADDRYARYL